MQEWIACLEECLPDFGINLSADQIEKLAKIMRDNAAFISDMCFEMRGGHCILDANDYQALYENTKNQLALLERENYIFRESVAKRRNVDLNDVRIENNTVMVYK